MALKHIFLIFETIKSTASADVRRRGPWPDKSLAFLPQDVRVGVRASLAHKTPR